MASPLSARSMLQVWEWGQNRHPLDRSLALLSLARPDLGREQLSHLVLGRRERDLFLLYRAAFGPVIQGTTSCSGCGQTLDFSLKTGDILPAGAETVPPTEFELRAKDYLLQYRLPDSSDLAAAVTARGLQAARRILVKRCLIRASRAGRAVPPSKLPARIISQLAESMSAQDPVAETLLNFTCPDCGSRWSNLLDISDFIWSAIGGRVSQLLEESHTLARAYGWRETDILSLSSARRQWYLKRVMA